MAVTLMQRIERLEAEGPIDPNSLDFSVYNPNLVRDRLAQHLAYSQAVEIEVPNTANVVRTILPNMSDEEARFVNIWDEQETQHGVLLGVPVEVCGIDPLPTREVVPPAMKLAGLIARVSSGMHSIVEIIYLAEGAMGERETLGFYKNLGKELNELGELPLSKVVGKIASQEAAHLGFYKQAAREMLANLRPWQVRFAKQFIERTYMPVGVRVGALHEERRRQFGHTALDSLQRVSLEELTLPIEKLARDLLGNAKDDLKPFVRKRYEECIEAYTESVAA